MRAGRSRMERRRRDARPAAVRLCFVASVGLVGLPSPAAADDVIIRITYVEIIDRILPYPNVTRTTARLEVRLGAGGALQHNEGRTSGKTQRVSPLTLKLGGQQKNETWRVAGPNRLINITTHESYERAILVTVSGQSCTAAVGYNLKPGHTEYRYNRLTTGEPAVAKFVVARDVVCTIEAAPPTVTRNLARSERRGCFTWNIKRTSITPRTPQTAAGRRRGWCRAVRESGAAWWRASQNHTQTRCRRGRRRSSRATRGPG